MTDLLNQMYENLPHLFTEAKMYLEKEQKLRCVKEIKHKFGLSLIDAKNFVDQWNVDPGYKAECENMFKADFVYLAWDDVELHYVGRQFNTLHGLKKFLL